MDCDVEYVELFQLSTSGWIRLRGRENVTKLMCKSSLPFVLRYNIGTGLILFYCGFERCISYLDLSASGPTTPTHLRM